MSSVETLGALERRLNASIPQQQLLGEVAARIKRLGRTAKFAGFRPGKVPYNMVPRRIRRCWVMSCIVLFLKRQRQII
jgi:trigger factor